MRNSTPVYIDEYKKIKATQKFSARSMFRKVALDIFSHLISTKTITKALKKPRIQFLYIHHIFKDEEKKLIQLIEFLQQHHKFISYSCAIEKIKNNDIDAAYICLSSDDGFKNNISAAQILNRYGISACFFINPSFVDASNSFEKSKSFCRSKLNLPTVEFMNWDDIKQLMKLGHEIGGHTNKHDNVASMSDVEFEIDCIESQKTMKYMGIQVKHFAWPYGRFFHFSQSKQQIVFDTGFETCASAERGCHLGITNKNMKKLCIRRDHIILDWPLKHIEYFLIQNSKKATEKNNYFPYEV